MIKGVIFDLWGTLAFSDIGVYIERINKEIGEENIEKFTKLRREWYTFKMDEEQFFTKLLKDCNRPLTMLGHLISVWDAQLDTIKLFPDTINILETLKIRGTKIIVISNTFPITTRAIEKLGLNKYVDYVFLSCNEGILKPSPFVYKNILDKFKLKPEEVIAVGDQIMTDITGSETYGIKSILIARDNKQEYKNKITELDEVEFYLK